MQEVGLVECLRQSDLLERGPANACPGSISIPGLLPGANERLRRSTTRTESIDRSGFARGSCVGPRLCGKRADGRSRNAAPCIDIIRRVIGVIGRSGDTGLVPRVYVALASHGGSCECGGGDQRSRQKCNWTHLISPSIRKPTASAPVCKWRGDRPIKVTFVHFVFKVARGRTRLAITGVAWLVRLILPNCVLAPERNIHPLNSTTALKTRSQAAFNDAAH